MANAGQGFPERVPILQHLCPQPWRKHGHLGRRRFPHILSSGRLSLQVPVVTAQCESHTGWGGTCSARDRAANSRAMQCLLTFLSGPWLWLFILTHTYRHSGLFQPSCGRVMTAFTESPATTSIDPPDPGACTCTLWCSPAVCTCFLPHLRHMGCQASCRAETSLPPAHRGAHGLLLCATQPLTRMSPWKATSKGSGTARP